MFQWKLEVNFRSDPVFTIRSYSYSFCRMISRRFSPDPSGRRGFVQAPPTRSTFFLMALKANRKFVHQTKTISFTKFTFHRLFGWSFHFSENSTFVWNVSGNRGGRRVGSGRRRAPPSQDCYSGVSSAGLQSFICSDGLNGFDSWSRVAFRSAAFRTASPGWREKKIFKTVHDARPVRSPFTDPACIFGIDCCFMC